MRLAALRDAPESFGSTHTAERGQDETTWRTRLRSTPWFVAEVAGEPVGLVRGTRPLDGPSGRRHLHSMWVHPDHRGGHTAAALIAAVRDWAVADGGEELVLWVVEGNAAAARRYAREGFAPTGLREAVAGRAGAEQEQWVLRLRPPAAGVAGQG